MSGSTMGGLAFDRLGSGAPLVLLHGMGHRRQAWYPVLELLAARRTVYALDLPGHGESPPLAAGTGRSAVEAMAAAVFGFLDEAGLDRPHLAGNSLGGALALQAAAAGRAASVTGLSPAGFWSGGWEFPYVKAMFLGAELTGAATRSLIPFLARSTVGRAVMDAAFVASPARMTPEQAVEDAYAFFRARDAVSAVLTERVTFTDDIPAGVPVTIAWGTRDRLLPPSQARIALHRIPQARFRTLPGCGHVPMTDNPELVAQVILDGSSRGSHG
jgi:pimeloyl-ACP methyl ester carboxylesterase